MKILRSLEEIQHWRKSAGASVGFVPTMGYLHEGHLSLVRRARAENECVVVSIFVNPLQFGPQEDFTRYPRDLERDLALLEPLGVDTAWCPGATGLYGDDFQTYVSVGSVSEPLEGKERPGHFKGVATVVAKLFNAVQPQRAYFGQKDAQQVAVIQQMVRDLNYSLEMVVCSTIREADGLALSSRNSYLKGEERIAARVLYRALNAARDLYELGERRAEWLCGAMEKAFAAEPLVRLQYVSAADPRSLRELDTVEGNALFSLAAFVGNTRLIDNFLLQNGEWFAGERLLGERTNGEKKNEEAVLY